MSKPFKLHSALKYQHFALVTLRGRSFPLDALRYDNAFFWHEADARAAESSMFQIVTDQAGQIVKPENPKPAETHIIISKHDETAKTRWALDVWNSFSGVKIEPIDYDEAWDIYRKRSNGDHEYLPQRLAWERTVSKAPSKAMV